MTVTRKDIVDEARTWLGVKFKKGGRDRTGVDCIGLLLGVGYHFGFDIEDSVEYSFNPEPTMFQHMVYDQTVDRNLNDVQEGSIVILRQSVFPMHTGILAKSVYGGWSIINANLKERRVVEQSIDVWKDMLIGLRDYREMA